MTDDENYDIPYFYMSLISLEHVMGCNWYKVVSESFMLNIMARV